MYTRAYVVCAFVYRPRLLTMSASDESQSVGGDGRGAVEYLKGVREVEWLADRVGFTGKL